jgi:phenylpyruvate tautomerase PptA (4-oxalocrotonate tautomerase family)
MQMTSKQTSARIVDQLTSLLNRGRNVATPATVASPDVAGKGKSQTLVLVEQPEAALAAQA